MRIFLDITADEVDVLVNTSKNKELDEIYSFVDKVLHAVDMKRYNKSAVENTPKIRNARYENAKVQQRIQRRGDVAFGRNRGEKSLAATWNELRDTD